jgi:O-antigen/teichoic acid export membrane protein
MRHKNPEAVVQMKTSLGREIGQGTLWLFLAEALALPGGLLIARILSLRLGPAQYGRYGLATAIVLAAEWLIVAAYARISVQLLSYTQIRDELERSVIRHYLFTALLAAAALLFCAKAFALALHAPSLASDLRWLCLDVPLFALAYAQRSILTARREYSGRASAIAVRWVSRVSCTWVFLTLGFGVHAALWAWPLSSFAEIVCIRKLPLRLLFESTKVPVGLWREAWAPFLFAAGQRILERIDLILLQALGTAAPSIGLYVAAQNMSVLPGLFAGSLSPVLIAAMTREYSLGREGATRQSAALSLKITLYLLPLAAVFGFCGPEIATFAFGPSFRGAGSLTGWLMVSYIGIALASTAASIISSQGKHRLTAYFSLPAAALAGILQSAVIPQYGVKGAAIVSAAVGLATGLAAMAAVYRMWNQSFPIAMVLRAAAGTLAAVFLAQFGPVYSFHLPARLCCLLLVSGSTLLVTGEWQALPIDRILRPFGRADVGIDRLMAERKAE